MNIPQEKSSSIDATDSLLIPKYVRLASNNRLEFNKNFFATYGSVEQGALALDVCKPTLETLLKGRIVRRSTMLRVLTGLGIVELADRIKLIDFNETVQAAPQPIEPPGDLRTATYDKLLGHLAAWKEQGKVVIFTDQLTNICLDVSDSLTPKLFKGDAKKALRNQSYIRVWSASEAMPAHSRLVDLIEKDGFVRGYEHELVRPDGIFERYATDFHLIDWMGKQVRVGVTDPKDFHEMSKSINPEKAIAAYPALRA